MKPSLDNQIAALEAKIPTLKAHSEERAHLIRKLRELRIQRMRKQTKFRARKRKAA